jgi:fatty-acyl-CoA synthase
MLDDDRGGARPPAEGIRGAQQRCRLVDRAARSPHPDRVAVSGGENIYPAEVENALREHPAVADCGVIGVPDTRWGEVGRAVVVLRPGAQASEEELLGFLDGKVARFKIPKSVRFTGTLPRTGTGKILKKRLRETHGDG